MRIKITDHKEFKDSINAIKSLVSEAMVVFNEEQEQIEITSMDFANVCMILFRFPSSKCEEWDVKEKVEIGLNLNNLSQYLKAVKGKAEMVISIDDKEKSRVVLEMKGAKSNKKFKLPVVEIETHKEQKKPKLTFETTVKVDNDILKESVDDMELVGESFFLETKGKKFTIIAEGDLNTAEIEILEAEIEGEAKAKYSNEYMKKILLGAKISERAIMKWSKEYPLSVKYVVDGGCTLEYILAPRVTED